MVNKLEAVKLYKVGSGLSLRKSKRFVEHMMRQPGVEDPIGCAAAILLAVVAGADVASKLT